MHDVVILFLFIKTIGGEWQAYIFLCKKIVRRINADAIERIKVHIGESTCIRSAVIMINPAPNIYKGKDPKNTFDPSNPENGSMENNAKV